MCVRHGWNRDTFKALWEFPVPIIAAVEGFAYAGGCELALGTDFIVASATAEFALKEVTRGILPGGGGLQNLARGIGMRRAREMIYTGRAIDAETAYVWGLVNRVVPAADALEKSLVGYFLERRETGSSVENCSASMVERLTNADHGGGFRPVRSALLANISGLCAATRAGRASPATRWQFAPDGSVATLKTETKEGPRGTGRPGLRPPDRIAGR